MERLTKRRGKNQCRQGRDEGSGLVSDKGRDGILHAESAKHDGIPFCVSHDVPRKGEHPLPCSRGMERKLHV